MKLTMTVVTNNKDNTIPKKRKKKMLKQILVNIICYYRIVYIYKLLSKIYEYTQNG